MVKIISEGIPPWVGKWQCDECGERIETTAEDEAEVCYNLPANEKCTLPWGYAYASLFFDERMIGPCKTCKKEKIFWPVSKRDEV